MSDEMEDRFRFRADGSEEHNFAPPKDDGWTIFVGVIAFIGAVGMLTWGWLQVYFLYYWATGGFPI